MPIVGPMAAYGQMSTVSQPTEPFVWGAGGSRLSIDDLTQRRRMAMGNMMSGLDASPVGHWTQGAARAATGLLGGFQMREADKLAAERGDAQQAIIRALMEGQGAEGGPDPIAAALADPELRDIGMQMLEYRNPKPPQMTDFGRLLAERDALDPNSPLRADYDAFIAGKNDPQVTVTLPGGGIFVGPQSELATVLQGGGRQPAAPPQEAIDALKRGEGSPEQFDEIFGPGAAARVMGGSVGNGAGGFPGG